MAKHFSIRDFFRHMPNALLARFFHAQNLLLEFDFAGMQLDEKQRHRLDAEFRDIFDKRVAIFAKDFSGHPARKNRQKSRDHHGLRRPRFVLVA